MERPNSKGADNFIVGIFVLIAVLVASGFVVFMGGSSLFGKEVKVRTHFADVRGLNVGAPVFLSGIQIGRVASVEYPKGEEVKMGGVFVVLNVFSQFHERLRTDSEVSISTQGVLGDKVIVVAPGSDDKAIVKNGDLLPSRRDPELADYFAKGAGVVENVSELTRNLNALIKDIQSTGRVKTILANLDRVTASLASTTREDVEPAVKSLRAILAKIDKGEGTLGALINDSSLHEDLRAVLGGAKRSQVVRFLVRQAISGNEKEAAVAADPKKKTK